MRVVKKVVSTESMWAGQMAEKKVERMVDERVVWKVASKVSL